MEASGSTAESARMRFAEPLSTMTSLLNGLAAYGIYSLNNALQSALTLKEMFAFSADPPSRVKTYPCRSWLPVRIFVPEGDSSSSGKKLPTLFTLHGGGFVFSHARDPDPWNRAFADTHSVLVISLDYARSPVSPFPGPVRDVEELILAALSDPSLPIDHDRVALAGFSSGGNLALSVSSLPSMSGSGDGVRRIKAVVPIYPNVDFSVPREYKAQVRRYKPSLGGFRGKPTDYLFSLVAVFNWAYIPKDQDLQDPLLSPIYFSKDQLPPSVFIIGCELDMLGGEAWRMICGLADRPVGEEKMGRDEEGPMGKLILDDERYSFEVRENEGSYKWLLIPDQIHGFDHYKAMEGMLGDPNLTKDAELKTAESQKVIAEWLFAGPFGLSK